jgi:hypothetical protein
MDQELQSKLTDFITTHSATSTGFTHFVPTILVNQEIDLSRNLVEILSQIPLNATILDFSTYKPKDKKLYEDIVNNFQQGKTVFLHLKASALDPYLYNAIKNWREYSKFPNTTIDTGPCPPLFLIMDNFSDEDKNQHADEINSISDFLLTL